MFDVFQNVFGRKKPVETSKTAENEGYVVVDPEDLNDPDEHNPSSRNPYADLLKELSAQKPQPNAAETTQVMTIQDVPFVLNTKLNAPILLDQIWKSLGSCMASISKPTSLEMEYDFTLEKSVISEK